MQGQELEYQRTERRINGVHFYPVHLTNRELHLILMEAFAETIAANHSTLKLWVRADRGNKGIDFRLEETLRKPHQVVRQRMFTFGLNANWQAVDFFEHYTHGAGGQTKEVAGKKYHYPRYVAQEYIGHALQEPDAIYARRQANQVKPERNPLFQTEGWSCLYEQDCHLETLEILSR
ncbi:hypothetical protein ACD591_01160 [Rufibacter glacialis]|uniref:Uncharacterized protein n=1 Tax=Rufibacter glacialis TaxID=1259555 RepID=A0A5M8QJR2_9BACT|nr:hypothetical protein [Rufibacter glacialis]KAA6435508.1 hypothetical protein FOE74_06060 [Rufibacter glacialis]GGK64135.1 hypothetical protein GCM10011405_10120 [Rufibacter glacialis]